jgi:hypothetical protein
VFCSSTRLVVCWVVLLEFPPGDAEHPTKRVPLRFLSVVVVEIAEVCSGGADDVVGGGADVAGLRCGRRRHGGESGRRV